MKHASLSELAIQLGINKSKLAYYHTVGLLKPISKVGRMNIFDEIKTLKKIEKIITLQRKGKNLEEIKKELR
jgi:DNA-binding transcriptional MerR regulator